MEKGPEIRIIGKASSEKKGEIKKEAEKTLFNHFESLSPEEGECFKKFEYPKSKKEIALINFANKETCKLMKKVGVESYEIPVENFHIVPPEIYKRFAGENGVARADNVKKGVVFNAEYCRDNPVFFGAVTFHEMLHLKAYLSVEAQEINEDVIVTPYREGITVLALQEHTNRGNYHEHFSGLHEAIVAEAEKKFLPKIFDCPELREEKEWILSEEAKEMKKKLAEEKGISEKDIIWVGKKGKDDWEIIPYSYQRKVLNYVCQEIKNEFSDQFQDIDDVYNLFLKAHFTGKILSLARFVEKTFGRGSFRLLSNMTTEKKSGVLHLESLKKARLRQMKKK